MKKNHSLLVIIILLTLPLVSAATLQGSIYNFDLEIEEDVLIEINTTPTQKFLSKDGSYSFELSPGEYFLTARKGFLAITEEVKVVKEGTFVYDLFLLPGFTEEDELWQETNVDYFTDVEEKEKYSIWRYLIAFAILIFALRRFGKVRKKYGSLRKFKRNVKEEQQKTVEQHKKEIAQEPSYLDNVVEIIKKNDGRITQKELRKEMLHLSEAKISLIISELEHKGKVEKFKKGRGNVIILK